MVKIRHYQSSDAEELLAIYRPFIENTAVTFETSVPSMESWKERIEKINHDFPWLVAVENERILGYAYATRFRERKAYDWCCESSVYLVEDAHGKGIAKILYENLFGLLRAQGYVNVYAIMTSPNPKSEKFHASFGFYDVGKFTKSGYKFGNWYDTHWMQLHLSEHLTPPKTILQFSELEGDEFGKKIP